LVKIENM
jgi:hypothetical protein